MENSEFFPTIKAIIFDCDGVLLDSEEIGGRIEVSALKKLGISIEEGEYNKRFSGVTTMDALQTVTKESGVFISDAQINEIEDEITKSLEKEVKVIPHVAETLQAIRLPKAVASNSHFPRLLKLLNSRHLDQYFDDCIFSADMVSRPKPYPDLYQFVAKKMGVLPSECLVIEDSPIGARAAHEAGMKVLGFIGTAQSQKISDKSFFEAGVDIMFNDMLQLPELIQLENRCH
ncbi:MAG: HAD family phosphatase [Alphaproteobacteria bacterium]|nr:HAD family phosphatase [Alphaproteobacteria bacterium]